MDANTSLAKLFIFKSLYPLWTLFNGGSRGGSGGSITPPPPCNILWKWNNLVSVRPKYFIFMGFLRKLDKINKANRHTSIHLNPLSRNPGSAPVVQPDEHSLQSWWNKVQHRIWVVRIQCTSNIALIPKRIPLRRPARNKNSNNQGRSPNVVKVILHTIRQCSRSICEQILSFKRCFHFEKGRIWREPLIYPVVSLFFSVLATPLVIPPLLNEQQSIWAIIVGQTTISIYRELSWFIHVWFHCVFWRTISSWKKIQSAKWQILKPSFRLNLNLNKSKVATAIFIMLCQSKQNDPWAYLVF